LEKKPEERGSQHTIADHPFTIFSHGEEQQEVLRPVAVCRGCNHGRFYRVQHFIDAGARGHSHLWNEVHMT
jgi:hypothetical protein